VGDERNVLLTLVRMIVTAQTGQIVSKDEAVAEVLHSIQERHRPVLSLALAGYLGEVQDDWAQEQAGVSDIATYLAERIRALLCG